VCGGSGPEVACCEVRTLFALRYAMLVCPPMLMFRGAVFTQSSTSLLAPQTEIQHPDPASCNVLFAFLERRVQSNSQYALPDTIDWLECCVCGGSGHEVACCEVRFKLCHAGVPIVERRVYIVGE
jgi:hypothetical protein